MRDRRTIAIAFLFLQRSHIIQINPYLVNVPPGKSRADSRTALSPRLMPDGSVFHSSTRPARRALLTRSSRRRLLAARSSMMLLSRRCLWQRRRRRPAASSSSARARTNLTLTMMMISKRLSPRHMFSNTKTITLVNSQTI